MPGYYHHVPPGQKKRFAALNQHLIRYQHLLSAICYSEGASGDFGGGADILNALFDCWDGNDVLPILAKDAGMVDR